MKYHFKSTQSGGARRNLRKKVALLIETYELKNKGKQPYEFLELVHQKFKVQLKELFQTSPPNIKFKIQVEIEARFDKIHTGGGIEKGFYQNRFSGVRSAIAANYKNVIDSISEEIDSNLSLLNSSGSGWRIADIKTAYLKVIDQKLVGSAFKEVLFG